MKRMTVNELVKVLNGGNNHGCNQWGCKAGRGKSAGKGLRTPEQRKAAANNIAAAFKKKGFKEVSIGIGQDGKLSIGNRMSSRGGLGHVAGNAHDAKELAKQLEGHGLRVKII